MSRVFPLINRVLLLISRVVLLVICVLSLINRVLLLLMSRVFLLLMSRDFLLLISRVFLLLAPGTVHFCRNLLTVGTRLSDEAGGVPSCTACSADPAVPYRVTSFNYRYQESSTFSGPFSLLVLN